MVLLIFGPKNLPKLGKAIGRTVNNMRAGMEGKDRDDDKAVEEGDSGKDDADKADDAEVETVEVKDEDDTADKAESSEKDA
ncbi:MAG: Sec-independent protein translocase subunit TatA/TatB [Coriobacteriales bacterium]